MGSVLGARTSRARLGLGADSPGHRPFSSGVCRRRDSWESLSRFSSAPLQGALSGHTVGEFVLALRPLPASQVFRQMRAVAGRRVVSRRMAYGTEPHASLI